MDFWMSFILVSITIVMKKQHHQKQVEGKRVYLTYFSTSVFIEEGNQGRNLEAGAGAEAIRDNACWLAQPVIL